MRKNLSKAAHLRRLAAGYEAGGDIQKAREYYRAATKAENAAWRAGR